MTALAGPEAVLEAASEALESLRPALSPSGVRGSRAEWTAALGRLQQVADVVGAAQDAVMVALAAIDEDVAEDGTVREVHRGRGHVALDAPAIVSGALVVTAVQAERRVRSAVRLAADGPAGTGAATGLGGLHAAMAAGRLDAWRAQVVAEELELAPAEVASSVVGALAPYLDRDDAPALRRRCRRVLARVSPDLLRQRALRARAESRLERWASEPGVDTWHGTFPSEEAARAWAAVDALAQRYVADGTCAEIGRARAKALTDLVEGSAHIDTVVTLVVPAPSDEPPTATSAVAATAAAGAGTARAAAADGVEPVPGRLDRVSPHSRHGSGPSGLGDSSSRHRQGSGGPDVDEGHRSPGKAGRGGPDVDEGHQSPGEAGPGGRDDHEDRRSPVRGECRVVARSWLARAVAATRVAGRDRSGRVRVLAGDARTGALVDPGRALATDAYRPGAQLAALLRARDGRCRFPGCHVASRFCDLDHVRPWPAGPTAADNLICLCRRHHRVKQRPGWRVALAADGTATWTNPIGQHRTTSPVDALHRVVLPARAGEPDVEPVPRGRPAVPDGPHSVLEHTVEHRLPGRWHSTACRAEVHRPDPDRWRHTGLPHRACPGGGVRSGRHPPADGSPPF